MKDLLARLENLLTISFVGGAFVAGSMRQVKEDLLKFCMDNMPILEQMSLENTHISKKQGMALSRAVKAMAKRGFTVKIGTTGTTGQGIQKMMTNISLSKSLFGEFCEKTGFLTLQWV